MFGIYRSIYLAKQLKGGVLFIGLSRLVVGIPAFVAEIASYIPSKPGHAQLSNVVNV